MLATGRAGALDRAWAGVVAAAAGVRVVAKAAAGVAVRVRGATALKAARSRVLVPATARRGHRLTDRKVATATVLAMGRKAMVLKASDRRVMGRRALVLAGVLTRGADLSRVAASALGRAS